MAGTYTAPKEPEGYNMASLIRSGVPEDSLMALYQSPLIKPDVGKNIISICTARRQTLNPISASILAALPSMTGLSQSPGFSDGMRDFAELRFLGINLISEAAINLIPEDKMLNPETAFDIMIQRFQKDIPLNEFWLEKLRAIHQVAQATNLIELFGRLDNSQINLIKDQFKKYTRIDTSQSIREMLKWLIRTNIEDKFDYDPNHKLCVALPEGFDIDAFLREASDPNTLLIDKEQ